MYKASIISVFILQIVIYGEWPTPNSNNLIRPILFVHGINSDMGGWGAIFPDNASSADHINGNVKSYKEEGAAFKFADYYQLQTGSYNEINHNGLEFYNSTNLNGELAPFLTTDPRLNNRNQTNLLYLRLEQVLNEYFGDTWLQDNTLKVDLVAHSQGGLVIRAMIEYYRDYNNNNPVNHINSIITVDSPHLGSALADDNSDYDEIEIIREIVLDNYSDGNFNNYTGVKDALDNFTYGDDVLGSQTSFLQWLNQRGFPQSNGYYIPMTTMYGISTNIGNKLADYGLLVAADACQGVKDAINAEIDLGCGDFDWYNPFDGDFWCNVGDGYVNLWKDIEIAFTDIDESAYNTCVAESGISLSLFLAGLTTINEPWANKGDFIVQKESQIGEGVFDEEKHPFKKQQIIAGPDYEEIVPHMDLIGFPGAATYGYQIISALENVAEPKKAPFLEIVPTIISPLLLI
ncbi:MAG: hypothetical protein HQK83_16550 [Fibrobacteria bacterium]|nr:hypothetical protein [Fibrobacteria bacterium]